MTRCAHDPTPYFRFLPVGVNLKTGKLARLLMSPVCPYNALEDSQYCLPHSILHGEHHAETAQYISDTIYLYRTGKTYIMPNGQVTWPTWWMHRFN